MTSSRVLAGMLFVASCEKPGAPPTTISAPPTDAKEPAAPAVSPDALCAALMPTSAGAWESAAQRRATLDRLIAQRLVTECDQAAPAAWQPDRRADETAYCRAAIMHEICKRDGERRRSLELRTRAFPTSADAWLALGMARLGVLRSEEGGLGYTVAIAPVNRIQIADEAIETLQIALRVRPDDARAYALIAAAYDQRSHARNVVPKPRTRAEKRAVADAKADRELAWQAQQKACELDRRPSCQPVHGLPAHSDQPPQEMDGEEQIPERTPAAPGPGG